ncbi:unnamed protein product [Paramecium sonneborni]|uniref:EGF-like domain-containing protein n=1 Tax=Paramecium sonneborni TaxID=65129 RepID=A0A8S1QUM4_9CILI|nr:unnamed protein product [Paramecium sonneborni]
MSFSTLLDWLLVLIFTQLCQSCDDGQYLDSDNQCQQCDYSCEKCEIQSINCISCIIGMYLSDSQCLPCQIPCKTCVDNNSKCQSCVDGYYWDYSSTCNECTKPCFNCHESSDFCLSCQPNFQIGQIIGGCECSPEGYIQIDDVTCLQCIAPCKTCTISEFNCLSCIDLNQILIYDDIQNFCLCRTGWILDINGINCIQCQLPCKDCNLAINKCITCNDDIHQSGETCSCEPGWVNNQNFQCIQCEKPCKTCNSSTQQCDSCEDPNHYISKTLQCICKSGYYSNTISTCLKCKEPCNECNIQGCINCIDINQIVDINQKCICKDQYYFNGFICAQCQKPCNTCIDSYNKCLTCLDPNSQIYQYQCQCKPGFIQFQDYCCDFNCKNCFGINNCHECKQGFYLTSNSSCLPCLNNCLACSNQTYCEICNDGYFPNSDRQCINCIPNCKNCVNQQFCIQCMDGYYIKEDQCIQCNLNCQTCLIQAQLCQSCRINYQINSINKTCQCKRGYYENNNQCLQCKYPCKKCSNQDECQECAQISNLFLNEQNKCECKQGYYYFQQFCLLCDYTCLTCVDNSLNCLSCDQSKLRTLTGNSCPCIKNYFENENKVCYPCDSDEGKITQSCQYKNPTDFIWTYGEECDDGNEINRDGCSINLIDQYYSCLNVILQQSICFLCPMNCIICDFDQMNKKSFCTKCEIGYFLDQNQCVQCQNNCLECIKQPYNCLRCRYKQNLNNKCLDCQNTNGYYIDNLNINCYSKCGDGIKTQDEECDDGNILKGDGCNSQCQLENNYILQNGLSIIPVFPKPYLQSVGNSQIYSNNRQFQLSYNVDLFIHTDFQLKQFISLHFQKESTISTIDQEFELIQQIQQLDEPNKAQLILIINIFFSRNSKRESLIIKFHSLSQIKSFLGYSQIDSEIKCNIPKLIFIEDDTILQIQNITKTNTYLLYFIGAMFVGSLIFGGIDIFFNLLDNLQVLSYFKYLNLELPYNLKVYFNLFGFAQINFIQKVYDFSDFLDSVLDLNVVKQNPKKIAADYITLLSLINMSTILVIWMFLCLIYCVCKVIPKLFFSIKLTFYENLTEDSKLIKISIYYLTFKNFIINSCYILISEFFYSGILRVHMATSYDQTFSIVLQLQQIDLLSQNAFIFLSSHLGLLAFGLYLISIYFVIQLSEMKLYSIKCRSIQQKYGSIFEGLKKQSISKYFNAILLIKKLIFMSILVFGYYFPPFQICSIVLLSASMSFFLIIFKPLEDFNEYIKQLSCEINITFTLIFLMFLTFDNELGFLTYNQQQNLGWICIFFMTSIICIQLVVDAIQQWKLLYKKYKKIRFFIDKILSFIYPQKYISTTIKATPEILQMKQTSSIFEKKPTFGILQMEEQPGILQIKAISDIEQIKETPKLGA